MLNMLYRFGEERNLRFALPLGYQLGYPLPFNAHRVKGYRGPRATEFHIMGNHMRFNKPEVEKVMPADTFYFSIIRDPVALAESSFAYYKEVAPAFRKAKGLGDFVDDPNKYYDPRLRNNHYARNLLWFDFGMDNNANFSVELAQHDWYLYKAFNRTFWEDIDKFGRAQMEQEVALLRMRREFLGRVCLKDDGKPVEAYRIHDKNIRPFQSGVVKILGYELQPGLDNATRTGCLRMIRPEIQYKDLLDSKQFPRAVQSQLGQQGQGLMLAAGGAFGRHDSSRTGEKMMTGEAEMERERDWDGSRIMKSNQTLKGVREKERLR
ncbi:unnamed protein product [Oreochromis niloticus]|nr:unnamed protein product [Mustela putorius furo]